MKPATIAAAVSWMFLMCPATGQQPKADQPPTPQEIAASQKAMLDKIEQFGWSREGKGKLSGRSQVDIPRGYRFTGPSGTQKMLELSGNIASKRELGMLTTEGFGPWIIFEFDDVGYVKDDEKDSLDADAMLKSLQEGQEAGNQQRKKMGLDELELIGWAVPPRYNQQTNNLEWETKIRNKNGGHVSINYNTRLLGRKGVMEVALVCDPEEMDSLMSDYQGIIGGHRYVKNEGYAEYRQGDKVAQYGLAALVTGGAAVAAAKMGWFGKLGALFAKLGKGHRGCDHRHWSGDQGPVEQNHGPRLAGMRR